MIRKTIVSTAKTYIDEKHLDRAVEKFAAKVKDPTLQKLDVRYFVAWTKEGRCFPIFIGKNAVTIGVQFEFNVVG